MRSLPSPPPDVLALTRTLHERVLRALRRRGHLADAIDATPDEPADESDLLLAEFSSAAIQGRVALGPDAGAPITRFRVDPRVRPTFVPVQLCADWEGFPLHAKVRIEHDQRDKLERLCRYVARPPLATERLALLPDGRVAHQLRRSWRDGTTHVLFDPLTFIERLAVPCSPTTASSLRPQPGGTPSFRRLARQPPRGIACTRTHTLPPQDGDRGPS